MKSSKIERYLIALAIFGLIFFVAYRCTDNPRVDNFVKTDTVYKEKIAPLQPVQNNYPVKVVIQKEVDTVYRHIVEKQTIITGVEVDTKNNEIKIQKIDTAGKKTEEIHKIEEGSTAIIDNKNFEEKKKTKVGKFLQKSKKVIIRGAAIVGGIVIVVAAAKNL